MQTASKVTASAKAGMDKTKAVVQEKAEKATTRDPLQKQVAEEKKEAKIHEAERMKLQAEQEAAKHGHGHGHTVGTGTGTGTHGTTTGEGVHDPTRATPFH